MLAALKHMNILAIFVNTANRPLALRGHVTSFLWKWKLDDFVIETLLEGHLLNKIIVIWFFKPTPFVQNEKVRSWSRDQNLIFKIMNYGFLTQMFHLNVIRKMSKRWRGNVYSTSERNYQTFSKILAKSSFGRHVGGQEYALQHGGQYKSY